MLARYQIIRGKRPAHDPLPDGVRVDTRKHTRHVLRPEPTEVRAYLAAPSEESFHAFARAYEAELGRRFAVDPAAFAALAELATRADVYLGCSCPSRANPNVLHCHTVLALAFMKRTYPSLEVLLLDELVSRADTGCADSDR